MVALPASPPSFNPKASTSTPFSLLLYVSLMKYKQEKVKEHVRTSRTDWGSPTAEQGTARRHNAELGDDKIMALQNVNQSMHRAQTRSMTPVSVRLSSSRSLLLGSYFFRFKITKHSTACTLSGDCAVRLLTFRLHFREAYRYKQQNIQSLLDLSLD